MLTNKSLWRGIRRNSGFGRKLPYMEVFMDEMLAISKKELDRYHILQKVKDRQLT